MNSRYAYIKEHLKFAPITFIIMLVIWLLSSCTGPKYLISSNFYKLDKGMTEKAYLEWSKPNDIAINGRPANVKLFSYNGSSYKVYVYEIYQINGTYAGFDHFELVSFKDGLLDEYGVGQIPLTLRQNPNDYNINVNR
jgi:hypothetical protein